MTSSMTEVMVEGHQIAAVIDEPMARTLPILSDFP